MDPRVFFAAERTLLAWIRTGLTVIALGFVVARFGLFLTLLAQGGGHHEHSISNALGVALVVIGALILLGALRSHRAYLRSLPPEDIPRIAMPWLASATTLALAGFGLALAVYLAVA